MTRFSARYFDGITSRPHAVSVEAGAASLQIVGEQFTRAYPLAQTEVSEPFGQAPRMIRFADGSFLETTDHSAAASVLQAAGHRDRIVAKVQTRWHYALAACLVTIAAIALGYLYGLPKLAEFAAYQVPPEFEAALGQQAVKIVDRQLFRESKLPEARRAALTEQFARIAPRDERSYRLEFRSSRFGPNAVALPGGVMVMTDELVALAASDDEVIAVLAHELGHIERRHFLRRLISSAIVGAVVTLIASDASGLLTALPATLADLAYSRDMEREADRFAVDLLARNGLPPQALASMLERLDAEYRKRRGAKDEGSREIPDYLSTHPATDERINAIRGGR